MKTNLDRAFESARRIRDENPQAEGCSIFIGYFEYSFDFCRPNRIDFTAAKLIGAEKPERFTQPEPPSDEFYAAQAEQHFANLW